MATVTASALKRSQSEAFTASLTMPPALDQISPENLAAVMLDNAQRPSVSLRVIDVRPSEEFDSGHIRESKNVPLDDFIAVELCQQVAADIASGLAPLVVFVSAQSPDIDMDCALRFTQEWENQGLCHSLNTEADSFTMTLLGGLCYWLQQFGLRDDLTEGYVQSKWTGAIASLPTLA